MASATTRAAISALNPYGAGGSSQETTLEIVRRVHREFKLPVATHLTCVGHSRDELGDIADRIHASGFRNIGLVTEQGGPRFDGEGG